MPYDGPDDKNLPDYVKKMGDAMRKHWVGAWNGAWEDCMKKEDGDMKKTCEPRAFAIANAAVKKELGEKGKDIIGEMIMPISFEEVEEEKTIYHALDDAHHTVDLAGQLLHNIVASGEEDKTGMFDKVMKGLKVRLSSIFGGKAKKEAVAKTEEGISFVASDYAVVPEPDKPSTWKLRLAESKSGDFTVAQVARAITAMQPGGFRGQRVDLGPGDKVQAVSRISAAIGKTEGDDTQKENLRERLNAVKETTFSLTKDNEGNWRWLAIVSNYFRDKDTVPEIFESKAHKEYVAHLDKTSEYPELWLWHTPGAKIGKADMADFDQGFLVMSGVIDKDKADVAENLAQDNDLGVSHGYNFRYSDKEKRIIGWYRSFEISVLPKEKAANPWTGIQIIRQEVTMDAKKRAFLVEKLGEDRVKALESNQAEMRKELEMLGMEWKETETPPATPAVPSAKELTEAAVKAIMESPQWKAFGETLAGIKANADQVRGLAERVKALERSDDEKIAETIKGAVATKGFQASRADETALKDSDSLKKGAPNLDWLSEAVPLKVKS